MGLGASLAYSRNPNCQLFEHQRAAVAGVGRAGPPSGSDHPQVGRGGQGGNGFTVQSGVQGAGEPSLAAGCRGYRGGHRSRVISFLIGRTSSMNYCYCCHHGCCCGIIRWQSHRGSRSEPRDTCPTEGQGGCALAPGSSRQWRRLGLLSAEGFPEPSGLKPGPSEPRPSALIGADSPGQGFVHPAPEDSRVRSWVCWAGQKQFLRVSDSPPPSPPCRTPTGPAPSMQ